MIIISNLLSLGLSVVALTAAQQTQSTATRPAWTPPTLPGECKLIGASHAMTFAPGAPKHNTLVTTGDPETRRFIVYVPSTYSPLTEKYPVVYMLHGTSQTAQISMNKTTWNQAAETLGFIAVYPEALPYLLVDGTVTTKWHTDEVEEHVVDPSELPMADDALFIRELHNTIATHLSVDCDRIYASGFSNGGGFVKTKMHVELADIFAATTGAGGIGLAGLPSDIYPANMQDFRPHFGVVGTIDDKVQAKCVAAGDLLPGELLPRTIVDVIATPCMWDPLNAYASGIGLDASMYTASEHPTYTQFIWNTVVLAQPGPREYRFRILPNMVHEYPSGTNYPTDYVPIFYMWMSQFTR